MRYLFLAFCLYSCGQSESQQMLSSLDYWHLQAPTCEGFPAKGNCDDGDAVIFNGLLCAAGFAEGCTAVRDSQDADGRFWRSPRRARNQNFGQLNSFSRDQAMGVLLYLVSTKDITAAKRWQKWIKKNRACAVAGPFGTCLLDGPYRFCRDDEKKQCTITPNMWSMMSLTWQYLGLETNSWMDAFEDSNILTGSVEVEFTEAGYQLHLKAVQSFLRYRMGLENLGDLPHIEALVNKVPDNLFYQYLYGQQEQEILQQLFSVCPKKGYQGRFVQWAWERAKPLEAIKDSMLWDCLFLEKLLNS